MTKYIVKGCPCLEDILDANTFEVVNKDYCIKTNNDCKDIFDCKIKQIVELCKSAVDICNCKDADKDIDCYWCKEGGRADIGRKILQILKTQEVK